jgi:hypothetical protein
MTGTRVSAGSGYFLKDDSGGFDTEPGAAEFLRDQRRKVSGGGQFSNELIRILAPGIQFLPVLTGEFSAKCGYTVPDVLIIVHDSRLLSPD